MKLFLKSTVAVASLALGASLMHGQVAFAVEGEQPTPAPEPTEEVANDMKPAEAAKPSEEEVAKAKEALEKAEQPSFKDDSEVAMIVAQIGDPEKFTGTAKELNDLVKSLNDRMDAIEKEVEKDFDSGIVETTKPSDKDVANAKLALERAESKVIYKDFPEVVAIVAEIGDPEKFAGSAQELNALVEQLTKELDLIDVAYPGPLVGEKETADKGTQTDPETVDAETQTEKAEEKEAEKPAKKLPQTGAVMSIAPAALGVALATVGGAFAFRKRD